MNTFGPPTPTPTLSPGPPRPIRSSPKSSDYVNVFTGQDTSTLVQLHAGVPRFAHHGSFRRTKNEFLEQANACVHGGIDGKILKDESGAFIRLGIIDIGNCGGSQVAAEAGEVRLRAPAVSSGDEQVR